MFELKDYQKRALKSLSQYFQECSRSNDADVSFYKVTREVFEKGLSYNPVAELPGLPYVCLHLPTGGGKTIVACHAVAAAAQDLLHTDYALALWLVPSNAIRDQTLKALKDRQHPYRQALDAAFGSVTILDAVDALYLKPPTLSTSTVIIVSTLQAFRVDDTDGRKVYEDSGELMDHFTGLTAELRTTLKMGVDGEPVRSLENVLRLRRPIVIVDEAHNARTGLSFVTLARFNPACIIEFTATPDTITNPSNVLHSVSALELQNEDMIKMPIRLATRSEWKEVLSDAIGKLDDLQRLAHLEQQATGEYLRPIMLIQAQARSKEHETLTVEVVKQCLLDDFHIAPNEVAIATGQQWELDDLILTPKSKVRFVITVQALREGWDCPFAYVLCSVAEMRSPTAVEQILGRVMRLPRAARKQHGELNLAYAFVSSANFQVTALTLQSALIESGFEKLQADDLVVAAPGPLEDLPLFQPQTNTIVLPEEPNLTNLPVSVTERILYDAPSRSLTYQGVMSDQDRAMLLQTVSTPAAQTAIERVFRRSQGYADMSARSPAQRGEVFAVPVLAVQQGELFEEFTATHFLEEPWGLKDKDASISETAFPSQRSGGQQAEIKMSAEGRVIVGFIDQLHQQMNLLSSEQWDEGQLVHWLELNIPHPDIEPDEIGLFLSNLLRGLSEQRGLSLDYLIHHKYKLRDATEAKIDEYRRAAHHATFERMFDLPDLFAVRPDIRLAFDPARVPPYPDLYRGPVIPKHYYHIIGGMNDEEVKCAQYISQLPDLEFWLRNPVRTDRAFSIQTSTDRFYPDFICKLQGDRYLAVEYKSVRDWTNDDSKEKRRLGQLWAARSNGQCFFSMPRGNEFQDIQAAFAHA